MMKNNPAIGIEKKIAKCLMDRWNLLPYSITYTSAINNTGLLGITFFLDPDFNDFLNIVLEFKAQCDKSGYIVIKENNTIILQGIALNNLFNKLDDEDRG